MPKTVRPLWLSLLSGVFYVCFLIACLFVGTAAGWIKQSPTLGKLIVRHFFPQDPVKAFGTHQFTILVLGCDEDRTTGGAKITESKARSDMMLVAQVDFDKKLITGLSIPRDTLVGFGKYRERKINAYHAMGGNELAKEAVEALLPGVGIDRVVTLNFEGFVEMVDAVGGVPIDVEKRMSYDDNAGHLHIHLKPGAQVLDGTEAMGYVRFRHSDSDFARADRQHHFMLAYKDAVAKHPLQLPRVTDSIAKMLRDGLSSDEVASLGAWVKDIPKENIRFGSLPVYDVPGYNLRVKESELQKTLKEYNLLEGPLADNGQ